MENVYNVLIVGHLFCFIFKSNSYYIEQLLTSVMSLISNSNFILERYLYKLHSLDRVNIIKGKYKIFCFKKIHVCEFWNISFMNICYIFFRINIYRKLFHPQVQWELYLEALLGSNFKHIALTTKYVP